MLKKMIHERLAHVKDLSADTSLREEIRKIPKCELHVHLGGSIRRTTIAELAEKNGVPLPAPKKIFLAAATPLEFFNGEAIWELFHNTYKWHWSCIKSCDDLVRIVREFLEDSYVQGITHSEFTVSGSYLTLNFPFDEWTGAIADGIAEARKKYPVKAAAILDISRRLGAESAVDNVRQITERRPKCICGIGMGGDEVKYPHRLFKEAFGLARENNIPSTVHVSEFTPGETTIEALEELSPNRLGHALNTIKSPAAYETLKRSSLHVESCPLCNYVGGMGGVDNISEHPIRQFYRDGIPISINTDDPRIFGFDLIDNYVCLIKEAGFSIADLENINKMAHGAAFHCVGIFDAER